MLPPRPQADMPLRRGGWGICRGAAQQVGVAAGGLLQQDGWVIQRNAVEPLRGPQAAGRDMLGCLGVLPSQAWVQFGFDAACH